MPRCHAILAGLLLAGACTAAVAGDFVPRTGSGFAPVSDDPGVRSSRADAGAIGDGDSIESVHVSPGPAPTQAAATSSTKHVGVDDATPEAHAAAPAANADGDDKTTTPAANHKSRAALRWQSLLPGVMK